MRGNITLPQQIVVGGLRARCAAYWLGCALMADSARAILIAWAKSEGFAAVHNGQATDEAIVDDLRLFLYGQGYAVVPREPTVAMLAAGWGGHHDVREFWQKMFVAAHEK